MNGLPLKVYFDADFSGFQAQIQYHIQQLESIAAVDLDKLALFLTIFYRDKIIFVPILRQLCRIKHSFFGQRVTLILV